MRRQPPRPVLRPGFRWDCPSPEPRTVFPPRRHRTAAGLAGSSGSRPASDMTGDPGRIRQAESAGQQLLQARHLGAIRWGRHGSSSDGHLFPLISDSVLFFHSRYAGSFASGHRLPPGPTRSTSAPGFSSSGLVPLPDLSLARRKSDAATSSGLVRHRSRSLVHARLSFSVPDSVFPRAKKRFQSSRVPSLAPPSLPSRNAEGEK